MQHDFGVSRVEGRLHGPARRLRFGTGRDRGQPPLPVDGRSRGTPRRARPGGARVRGPLGRARPLLRLPRHERLRRGRRRAPRRLPLREDVRHRHGRAARVGLAVLQRWRIRPDANRAEVVQLDDLPIEFPRIDDSLAGLPIATATAPSSTTPTRSGRPPAGPLRTSDAARPSATPSPSTSHPVNRSSCVPRWAGRRRGLGADGRLRRHPRRQRPHHPRCSQFAGRPEAVVHLPARVPSASTARGWPPSTTAERRLEL